MSNNLIFLLFVQVVKRNAEEPLALPFAEFAGKYTIEYDIVNLDQLS